MTKPVHELVQDLSSVSERVFADEHRVLSFTEYLELVRNQPRQQTRTAAQYVADCFDYFGTEEIDTPIGPQTNYKLFKFVPDHTTEYPVEGLEHVQGEIYRTVTQFVAQAKVNRLILLHGPNGSAKSSLVSAIARAMEEYSRTDEGALYRFSWILPADRIARKKLGFSDDPSSSHGLETYAYLDDEEIATCLPGELNESPLLLFDTDSRRQFIAEALEAADISPDSYHPGKSISEGQLCPRSMKIFDALLRSYSGNLKEVWRHIRVERFFLSRRYRTGIATVEPQLHVDAGIRQLTIEQGLASLPTSLRNISLEQVFGDLVDANRGLVEYNDLLKRPVEAFKYLLSTCEKSSVAVAGQILPLDVLFTGTSNEAHLNEIKQTTDFASFKGRFELIQVAYLRNYEQEKRIYDNQVVSRLGERHIGPHTTELAALWAILTRLKKPDPNQYPEEARPLLEKIGPLEKADLFANGTIPEGFTAEEGLALRNLAPLLWEESRGAVVYEGLFGASPREIKGIIFRANERAAYRHLSPLALFEEIEAFQQEKNLYPFLKIEPMGDYHNYSKFLSYLRDRYRSHVLREVRTSLGYVDDGEFQRILERYLSHSAHAVRKESMRDPITGTMQDPDPRVMSEFEQLVGVAKDQSEVFRQEIVQRVGHFKLENPDQEPDLTKLFSVELQKAKKQYYAGHAEKSERIVQNALDHLEGKNRRLNPGVLEEVEKFIERLSTMYGYTELSMKEALGEYLRSVAS